MSYTNFLFPSLPPRYFLSLLLSFLPQSFVSEPHISFHTTLFPFLVPFFFTIPPFVASYPLISLFPSYGTLSSFLPYLLLSLLLSFCSPLFPFATLDSFVSQPPIFHTSSFFSPYLFFPSPLPLLLIPPIFSVAP